MLSVANPGCKGSKCINILRFPAVEFSTKYTTSLTQQSLQVISSSFDPTATMASGAIITGAASGLGLALAKNLLEKGWRVVMSDISPSGAKTATELQASNPAYEGKVLWVQSDVTDWDSQVRMFEKGDLPLIPSTKKLCKC